ncbi:MAG: 2-hydroxyacid dehydrogenase [Actinomycetes bacterium]
MSTLTALLPWRADELPGPLPLGVVAEYFAGFEQPAAAVLAAVEFYVLPYMGPSDHVALMKQMPRLRVVQTLTAGVDNVLGHVPPGVVLCNAAGVHDASTAELAVGLILAKLRGIDSAARDLATTTWDHGNHQSLADSTVMIIGFGHVGQAIGARLAPFEVELVPVALRARPGVHGVEDIPALLPNADVVVLALPLTQGTERFVDAQFLALMKAGALLVNVARGRVVDTDALVAGLQSERIQAALDVTDPEPLPPDHPLWTAPGVLITAHLGGATTAFPPRGKRLVLEQLERYAAGQLLANLIS